MKGKMYKRSLLLTLLYPVWYWPLGRGAAFLSGRVPKWRQSSSEIYWSRTVVIGKDYCQTFQRCIIVRRTCCKTKPNRLKGQSNEIFDLLFFHHFNQPGPLTNGLKDFRIWFRFRRDIRILIVKKLTRRGMIPRGVKKFNLERFCKNTKCSPLMVK